MTERTQTWLTRKKRLTQKEQTLKAELDIISTVVETNGKKILMIAGATAGVALISYFSYRAFKTPPVQSPLKKGKKKFSSMKKKKLIPKKVIIGTLLTDKLITMAASYIAKKLEDSFLTSDSKSSK